MATPINPLVQAVEENNYSEVRALLKGGATVDVSTLIKPVEQNRLAMVSLLIRAGASLEDLPIPPEAHPSIRLWASGATPRPQDERITEWEPKPLATTRQFTVRLSTSQTSVKLETARRTNFPIALKAALDSLSSIDCLDLTSVNLSFMEVVYLTTNQNPRLRQVQLVVFTIAQSKTLGFKDLPFRTLVV